MAQNKHMKFIASFIVLNILFCLNLIANEHSLQNITKGCVSLSKINSFLKYDDIDVIDSYVFMFDNRWSSYTIKIVTFEDSQKNITNKCYYLMKNHHGEKLINFKITDLDAMLKKFLVIYNHTEKYSKIILPSKGILNGSKYQCIIELKNGLKKDVLFDAKILPKSPGFEDFDGIEIYQDLIIEFREILGAVDKSIYEYTTK